MNFPLPDKQYTVIAVVITYNHAPYIEDALKGIIMQQVKFPFIVLILDDKSEDGTTDIIRTYEAQYPDLIKGFYFDENQFSQGKGTVERVIPWLGFTKYLALCDGDDYWTDPQKLQKQVDFMESNEDCTLCFHNAWLVREVKNENTRINYPMESREYHAHEFFRNWVITTASIMFRSNIFQSHQAINCMYDKRFIQVDVVLWLICASLGKVYGMKDVMSVHRLLENGYTRQFLSNSNRLCEINYKFCEHNKALISVFGEKLGDEFVSSIRAIFFGYNRKGQAMAISKLNLKYWCLFVHQSFEESIFQTVLSFFHIPKILMAEWLKKKK